MSPPNPLKPIQETLERVLHESGLHDFGRSMSSIDDLTEEVQHVYKRVDDIEQVLETIVPILERLTVIFEDIQGDLQPISELASKVPGSGSRRRRREQEAAAGQLGAPARPVRPSELRARHEGDPSTTDRPEPRGPAAGRAEGPVPPRGRAGRTAGSSAARGGSGSGPDRDAAGTTGSGQARPGATGYSPLGARPPRDD